MNEEVIYSKNILEFVTVAKEFCVFVENVKDEIKFDFIDKSQKLLSLLYVKASLIPDVNETFEDYTEKFVSENDWNNIQQQVAEKLGSHELFLDVLEPIVQYSDDTVSVSLSEIFADIYQDLMNFLTLYRIGTNEQMNDAVWECKNNFEQYWGPRLLSGLTAIHSILYSNEELTDDEYVAPKNQEINTDNWIISQRQKDWNNED